MEPDQITITSSTIRLGQLLKYAALVDDGAQAKEVIERGEVTVNGTVETQRGAQIRSGDAVTYAGHTVTVST